MNKEIKDEAHRHGKLVVSNSWREGDKSAPGETELCSHHRPRLSAQQP